jgi:heat shock protein HslJ
MHEMKGNHPAGLVCLKGSLLSRLTLTGVIIKGGRMMQNRRLTMAMVTLAFIATALTALLGPAEAKTPLQNEPANLEGTSWQFVKFQGGDDKTLTPDDKAKYTIAFGTDGRVRVRFDCNRGRGTWKSSASNQLQFGPLALTQAMCPPGSLHDRFVKDWGYVRSYIIKNGHLFLSLMADGGIYEFEPMGEAR